MPEDSEEDRDWKPDPSMDYMLKDKKFMAWYADKVARRKAMGLPLGDDPRDPDYDMYTLYKTGWNPPSNWSSYSLGEGRGHFPSDNPVTGKPLKADTNPRAVVSGIDTRTGKVVAPDSYTGPLTDKIKANAGKYADVVPVHKKGDGWNDDTAQSSKGTDKMAGMPPQGQPQQGQPQGQQQGPPPAMSPELLTTLLTFLAQHGGQAQPGQPTPQNAGQISPQSLQTALPGLLQALQGPPQQAPQQGMPQQGQPQGQQGQPQQQQKQQNPQQNPQQQNPMQGVMQLLQNLGIKLH